jgi:ABC-type transport system involved in cytochrome c biogenesis permease subunit
VQVQVQVQVQAQVQAQMQAVLTAQVTALGSRAAGFIGSAHGPVARGQQKKE